jgi:hypothetical protein
MTNDEEAPLQAILFSFIRSYAVTKLPQAALARGAHAPSRVLAGALAGQSSLADCARKVTKR